MTVLLANIRTPEGDAALTTAVEEARRRSTRAVVVNVTPASQVDSRLSAERNAPSHRGWQAHPRQHPTVLQLAHPRSREPFDAWLANEHRIAY